MSIASELLHDILRHGKVNIFFGVVPFEVDAAIEVANMIFNDVVCFSTQGIVEVLKVAVTNILNAKVVNGKVKPDGV